MVQMKRFTLLQLTSVIHLKHSLMLEKQVVPTGALSKEQVLNLLYYIVTSILLFVLTPMFLHTSD